MTIQYVMCKNIVLAPRSSSQSILNFLHRLITLLYMQGFENYLARRFVANKGQGHNEHLNFVDRSHFDLYFILY